MKNKFKIINSENEIGVVERIIGYDYRVIFNLETIHEELAQYDLAEIENLINSGSWKVLSDYNNFDVLPKEFKFVLKDGEDNCVFNYRDSGFGQNNVFWQEEPCGEGTGTYYTSNMVKGLLKDGDWLMLEDGFVPQDTRTEAVTYHQREKIIPNDAYKGNLSGKTDISSESTLQNNLEPLVNSLNQYIHVMSYNDSYFGEPKGMLKRTIREMSHRIEDAKKKELETDILQTIKQFAEEFDAQIVTCKEGYLVYSDNCTIEPYRANSDEELKEILQAIRVLKKYEGV